MRAAESIPSAADVMVRDVITLQPEMSLIEAIHVLLEAHISGAPVVDDGDRVIGMLSEHDCLRVLASDEYSAESFEIAGAVRTFMSPGAHTVPPELDLYGCAQRFLTLRVRRLPVVEGGRLVGQVSRRDVLRAIDRMRAARFDPPRSAVRGLYLSATGASPDAITD